MIAPEQLTAALERLDSRDWEVLDLSLRRRVPDEAMARIFECEPAEVARRRASAIESLADDLGVQRGEDLGTILKALLAPGTWEAADAERPGFEAFEQAPAEPGGDQDATELPEPGGDQDADESTEPGRVEPPELKISEAARLFRIAPGAEPGGPARRDPAPEPLPVPVPPRAEEERPEGEGDAPPAVAEREEEPAAEQEAPAADREEAPAADREEAPAADREEAPAADREEAPAGDAEEKPVSVVAPTNGHAPPDREPVLDMLADRDQERRRERMRAPLAWALGGTLGAALLVGAGFVGSTVFGDEESGRDSGGGPSTQRRFVPNQSGPLAAPFPSDPRTGACYTTATVRKQVTVHQRPGSRRTVRLAARTEWNSPRIFSVVRQRGGWLAVLAPELKNGEVGWMRAKSATLDCVRWSLHADLSRRRLYVRKNGRTVRKYRIAVGTRRNPTPKGRFAVTDKLKVTDKGSPYGCCVLALTGHQTKLPRDWPGGDRLAVHATSDLSSIGKRTSLGCMRVNPKQAGWLIKTVPIGTPIFIRA